MWAIRVFKTRTDGADACNGGKVKIGGVNAKPSKTVREGDIIEVHKASVRFTYKVLKLTENRMGAALVPQYALNLTPQEELQKMHAPVETVVLRRDKGAGRPTKKDRRTLDAIMNGFDNE